MVLVFADHALVLRMSPATLCDAKRACCLAPCPPCSALQKSVPWPAKRLGSRRDWAREETRDPKRECPPIGQRSNELSHDLLAASLGCVAGITPEFKSLRRWTRRRHANHVSSPKRTRTSRDGHQADGGQVDREEDERKQGKRA